MSTLSDVQALYGSVRDTWAKSQTHVVAHLVFAAVVFWLCSASLPDLKLSLPMAASITDNVWYKLAKDTGVVYATFVLPVVALAVYGALLRAGGQLLVTVLVLVLPPGTRGNRYRLLTPPVLEPLALTLDRAEFSLGDLMTRAGEMALKYQSAHQEQWQEYQRSIGELARNSQTYLGDFMVFLAAWVALWRFMPPNTWTQANAGLFWPVALSLAALAAFAWFRVSRAMQAMPALLLMHVSMMVRADADLASALAVPDERRRQVRDTIERLLREEQERADARPSIVRYVLYRLDLDHLAMNGAEDKRRRVHGRPFPKLYEAGERFAWDRARYSDYGGDWLPDYGAYVYYRLHRWLRRLLSAGWQLLRYVVTGAP